MIERAVITGATGYIGSNLATRLLGEQVQVTAIVREGSDTRLLQAQAERLHIARHCGSTDELIDIVSQAAPQVVFHLAAQQAYEHTPSEVEPLCRSNVVLTAQLLEACAFVGGACLINTGSYWQHADCADYQPNSLYAATKQAAQAILAYYCGVRDLRAVTLKLFDVYGPADPREKLFSLLNRAQSRGETLKMSPGEQRLDLVFITDVCDAYLHAADSILAGRMGGHAEAYAVGSTQRHRLKDVVALYQRVSACPVLVQWGGRAYRPGQVMEPWVGEPLPGWSAKVALEEGINRLLSGQLA